MVTKEGAFEVRVERHLNDTGTGEPVEELEKLDPVGGQRGHPVTETDTDPCHARVDLIGHFIHLRERVFAIVHREA